MQNMRIETKEEVEEYILEGGMELRLGLSSEDTKVNVQVKHKSITTLANINK